MLPKKLKLCFPMTREAAFRLTNSAVGHWGLWAQLALLFWAFQFWVLGDLSKNVIQIRMMDSWLSYKCHWNAPKVNQTKLKTLRKIWYGYARHPWRNFCETSCRRLKEGRRASLVCVYYQEENNPCRNPLIGPKASDCTREDGSKKGLSWFEPRIAQLLGPAWMRRWHQCSDLPMAKMRH